MVLWYVTHLVKADPRPVAVPVVPVLVDLGVLGVGDVICWAQGAVVAEGRGGQEACMERERSMSSDEEEQKSFESTV